MAIIIFCALRFHRSLGSQGCEHHFDDDPLDRKDSKFTTWRQSDWSMQTWIINVEELELVIGIGCASTAKEWTSIKELYFNEVNGSCTYELFKIMDNKQEDQSLSEFY